MATRFTTRFMHGFAALALSALLAACTATTPQGGDGAAAPPAVQAPAAPAPSPTPVAGLPTTQQPVKKPPPMSKPLPPERAGQPVTLDYSCKSDADCAVKDVGNCCGAYPACVNKDSPTNPAAVQAQCAASGMSSVCGFKEISACTCSAGKCQAAGDRGVPVAQ